MRDEVLVVVGDPCAHGCPAACDMGCVAAAGAAVDGGHGEYRASFRDGRRRRPRVLGADAGHAAARRLRCRFHRPCRRARAAGHLGSRGLRPRKADGADGRTRCGRSGRDDIAFGRLVAVLCGRADAARQRLGSVAGDSPVRRGGASRCLCCCGAVGAGGLVTAEDRRAHRLRRRMAGYAVRMFVQGRSGFRRRRAVPYRERPARAGVLRIPAVPRLSGAGSRRCAFRSAGPARVQVRRCGGASGRGRGRRPQALVPPSRTSLRSA